MVRVAPPHRFKVPLAENQAFGRPVHRRSTGVRAWPIWQLPHWLRAFVIAVVIADGVVLGLAASEVRFQGRDLAAVRRAAGEQRGHRRADPAGRREQRRSQGRVRDLGAARRPAAAAGLRAGASHRPHGPDPVAGPPRPRVPAGRQRGRGGAELRRCRLRLPWPDPPGARRGRSPGRPRAGLDADRGRLRGGAVDGQPGPALDGRQGLGPELASPQRGPRQGARLQRRGRAVRGGDRQLLRGQQRHRPDLRAAVHHLAAAFAATHPAGPVVAGKTPRPDC